MRVQAPKVPPPQEMDYSPRRQAKPLMFAESRAGDGGERGRREGEGWRRQPGRKGGREAAAEAPWTA